MDEPENVQPRYFLQLIENFNLLAEQNITTYKTIHEQNEYNLLESNGDLRYYLQSIKDERAFAELVESRMNALQFRNQNLLRCMHKYIKSIYEEAIEKYPGVFDLTMSFISFLELINESGSITKQHNHLIRYHKNVAIVWINALKWEQTYRPLTTRRPKYLFLRGQHIHPKCLELYILFISNRIFNRVLNYVHQVKVIIEAAYYYVTDIDTYVKILNEIMNYSSTENDILTFILKKMIKIYPNEAILYNTFAQMELNKYHIVTVSLQNGKSTIMVVSNEDISYTQRLQIVSEIYRTAVIKINTFAMWSFYINTMFAIAAQKNMQYTRANLKDAFADAVRAKKLTLDHFICFIDILTEMSEPHECIVKAFRNAFELYPTAASLWEHYLKYLIKKNKTDEICNLFQMCHKLPVKNLYDVYHLYYQYILANRSAMIDSFFDDAVKKYPEFKIIYLDHVYNTQGIIFARRLFNDIIQQPPYSLDFIKRMIHFEKIQLNGRYEDQKYCYAAAIEAFGKFNQYVWLDSIQFEMNKGSEKQVITELYQNALATLDSDFVEEFIILYRLKMALHDRTE